MGDEVQRPVVDAIRARKNAQVDNIQRARSSMRATRQRFPLLQPQKAPLRDRVRGLLRMRPATQEKPAAQEMVERRRIEPAEETRAPVPEELPGRRFA